jgi:hypothetical protein
MDCDIIKLNRAELNVIEQSRTEKGTREYNKTEWKIIKHT